MSGAALLRADSVAVRFAGVQALSGVSMEVGAGEVVAVIGPNGAGKTTLFNVLTGFVQPSAGAVHLRGQEVTRLAPAARARLGLGRTFQQGGLWLAESALGNVLTASHLTVDTSTLTGWLGAGGAQRERECERRRMAEDILEILGLGEYRDTRTGDMPYGSRKLLELGCALVARPAVLLLDEPAAGASGEEIPRLAQVIGAIRARLGIAVVIIEHHVPLVREVADRIYVLNFGELIAEGTPDEVTSHPAVVEAYLGAGATDPGPTRARRRRRAATKEKAGAR